MQERQETRIIQKLFWSLFPIQALATGLPAISTLVNSFIVGNYFGENALAAIGFVNPFTLCVLAISSVLSTGSQLLSGKCLGRGDQNGLNSIFTTMLISCIAIGLILSLAGLLIPDILTTWLGASGEIRNLTSLYIQGYGIGIIFSILSTCLITFLQMEQMKITSYVCIILSGIINVGGNIINILVLHWGIFGVSFFMSMSSVGSALTALFMLLIKGKVFHFSLKTLRFKTCMEIIKTGFPNAVHSLSEMLRNTIANRYLFMLGGSTGVAALAVANNVSSAIGSVISNGNMSSAKTISSILVGHRDVASLQSLPKVMIKIIFPLDFAAYILVFIFAKPIALLLGAEAEHISIYIRAIRLFNLWYITNALITPMRAIYHAMGKIKEMCIVFVFHILVFGLFACCVLSKFFGIYAIFSMVYIEDLLCLILFGIIFAFKARRMPKFPFEMCYIPDSIGAPRENCMNAAISSVDEAMDASKRLYDFCKEKGLPSRTAYASSLCVEEIAVDTIQHRFTKQKSTIDLRVIYEDGHISIMTRDDCPYFNPKEWLELCAPEDETRSIGIRMATQMAQDVHYVSTLGLNVLFFKV